MLTALTVLALSALPMTPSGVWALAPFEGVNLNEGHTTAAQAVLKMHLERLGQRVVVLPAGGADVASAAKEQGATATLRGSLVRLGQLVKVTLTLEPEGGAPKVASLDAASPEDLDPVLMRLARHLVNGEPLDEGRVSEMTEKEEDAYLRKRANSYFGVEVTGLLAKAGGHNTFLSGANLYWLYDARSFFADITAGFSAAQGHKGGSAFNFNVALLYPLADRDLTPYVGGGAGYGMLEVDGPSGHGLTVFGDVGAMFGRTSTVHFRADLRPFVTTYKLEGGSSYDMYGYPIGGETSSAIAFGAMVALGVGF